ncbi:hypothetical protein P152DRAFT_503169 [Eremomyces bilateralis CBS 781.70]|uniref:Uncharacterized protein n=1 Tax=Eremomyces bilateralis CBS 781.70 TaxID=1392243 RepID=A0A6G1FPZ1_9PEZI|nr:uncharacterized protein P152DRAFT_503169 [Eremomyces bilateralis CBS 781.70]KAF1807833.1 hypothetical protein P152DRAFT_503169 [Eremomyces bilateralis CBS 781.70]
MSSFPRSGKKGDTRRRKQVTIDESISFDFRASIALNKISKDVQTHVGRINRAGILAAEAYVISNRDVQSMDILDQWLHYIDTEEILPLFDKINKDYNKPKLPGIDWGDPGISQRVVEVSQTWARQKEALYDIFTDLGPALLKELVLAANTFQYAVYQSFLLLLQNLQQLSLHNFADLVELISLTICDAELAIELLLECLEPESQRLLVGNAIEIDQITKCFIGLALNHIDMISNAQRFAMSPIPLMLKGVGQDGY